MNRHTRLLFGAAVLSLTLAACGGDDATGTATGGPGQSSSKALVVAFPVPLTSGNKATAEEMVNTAKLAVKKINAEGGAGGRQITLQVYDDKLAADESAKVAQRALTVDGAEVFMGGYTSIEGLALRQVTEARKVVYIATSTISPQLTQGATYTFRLAHDQNNYPLSMAALYKQLGYDRPVVIHDNGATGSTIYQPIQDALQKEGISAGAPSEYTLNATDVSSAVSAVVKQQPDSVILIGSSAADAGLVVKTLVEQGLKVPVLGFGSLVAPDSRKIGGAAFTQVPAVYTLANTQPSKPSYVEFVTAYAAEYGGDANQLKTKLIEANAQTWDAFTTLKTALDSTKGDASGDRLAKALHEVPPFEGVAGKTGSQISFSSGQDAFSKALVAFKLEGDSQVEVTG